MHRAICILITDYSIERIKALESESSFIGEVEEFNNLKYHTKWQIIESEERKIILTNQLEIHIISLEELRKTPEVRKKQEKLIEKELSERIEEPKKIKKIKLGNIKYATQNSIVWSGWRRHCFRCKNHL